MLHKKSITAFLAGVVLFPALWWGSSFAFAQNSEIDQLKNEIQASGNRLQEIEKEIARYEEEIKKVGAEKNTLQSAIKQLELERGRVQTDIKLTEEKIGSVDMELSKLELEIISTEDTMDLQKAAIAEIIRRSYKLENQSLIEVLLSHSHLSEFWSNLDTHETIKTAMASRVDQMKQLRELLGQKHGETEGKRIDLVSLRNQYSDKNTVLTNNRAEQAELLNATQREEANYQQLLKDKQAARDQITKDLRDFESRLQFILDPNTVPTAGTAVFSWPLKNVIITQYFGGTEFAARNASVYGGRAYHPGIDLGAPRGTAIHAPLSGTVRATGNTDLVAGCYSWGKWTLIDHANGLTTLYAHQDVISVSPGQSVSTGEIIGYVGNTGYSTGPHLHFTVYAKDGVSVRPFNQIRASTSCGSANTPVAATEAYLDPILYLPPL